MSELNNLIPISYDNPERPTVSGRELHEFLKIETPYAKWFCRMVEGGFFTEGEDFATVDKNVLRADGTQMPQIQHDHQLTIPMAKELCMIQRNERGKQARQYFLAVEAQWNSPEAVMRRAVLIAQKQNDQLKPPASGREQRPEARCRVCPGGVRGQELPHHYHPCQGLRPERRETQQHPSRPEDQVQDQRRPVGAIRKV